MPDLSEISRLFYSERRAATDRLQKIPFAQCVMTSAQRPTFSFDIHQGAPISKGTMLNYHTHHLQEKLNHMDLQIVLPLEPQLVITIFHCMVEKILEGQTFQPDQFVEGILEDQPIYLVLKREEARPVLRVIFPDSKGRFPDHEQCDAFYRNQLYAETCSLN